MKKTLSNTLYLLQSSEKKRLAYAFILFVIINAIDIVSIIYLLLIINIYTGNSPLQYKIPQWLTDSNSLIPITIFVLFYIVKNIASYAIMKLQSVLIYKIASRISKDQLLQYLNGSFTDYVELDRSKLNHRIHHEPIEFVHYVLSGFIQMFNEAIISCVAILIILIFNPFVFSLLLLFLSLPILLSSWHTKKKLKSVKQFVKLDSEKTGQYLNESLNSYVESTLYDKKDFFIKRYITFQSKLNNHLANLQTIQWLPSKFIEIFVVLGLFIIIALNKLVHVDISMLNVGAFIAAAYKIIPGIVKISNLNALIKTYEYTVSDLQCTTNDSFSYEKPLKSPTKIEFRNVFYSYGRTLILNNISVTITKGDFICISGASGKGKTTFVNILLGFLQIDSGQILFDDSDTQLADRKKNQTFYSYVKQQNFLIHDTILTNIVLNDEKYDEVRLENAITLSGLRPIINSLIGGIHHTITENGKNISGGQRQRIAIARALYKNADIIVLDEPFNELDEISERVLLDTFKKIAENNKIVILLSHSSYSKEYCNKTLNINA